MVFLSQQTIFFSKQNKKLFPFVDKIFICGETKLFSVPPAEQTLGGGPHTHTRIK